MELPQIIYITLTAISLLLNAYTHGKPREDNNFWNALLAGIIVYGLLIWGGFFR